MPWGQGQTPIKEVLQLVKKEKWAFPAEPERSGDRQPQAARNGERSESNRPGKQDPRWLRCREGSREVRAVLPRGAGVSEPCSFQQVMVTEF